MTSPSKKRQALRRHAKNTHKTVSRAARLGLLRRADDREVARLRGTDDDDAATFADVQIAFALVLFLRSAAAAQIGPVGL